MRATAADDDKLPSASSESTPIGMSGSQYVDPDTAWTGRLVGLILPPGVDPAFDGTAKPGPPRRIDPGKIGTTGDGDFAAHGPAGWNPWRGSAVARRGRQRIDVPLLFSDECDKSCDEHEQQPQVVLDAFLFPPRRHADEPPRDAIRIHLNRDPDEASSKTLRRLQLSIQKKLETVAASKSKSKKKKSKKQKLFPGQEAKDQLPSIRRRMDGDSDHLDATKTGSIDEARICLDEYETWDEALSLGVRDLVKMLALNTEAFPSLVSIPLPAQDADMGGSESAMEQVTLLLESCPPTIISVRTFGNFEESRVFATVPIVIGVTLIYAERARISWFVDGREVCHDSRSYAPKANDVGKMLSILIVPLTPGHDGVGCEEAYQFARPIEALPFMPIMSPLRNEWVTPDDGGLRKAPQSTSPSSSLRVVTYNILADQNASRDLEEMGVNDKSRTDPNPQYPQIDPGHLIKWRRHPMIIAEILSYSPDIICLQEVDDSVFDGLLLPVLSTNGYQGYFGTKGVSSQKEGCAIFWSLDVFERVSDGDMATHSFADLFQAFCSENGASRSDWKSFQDIAELLEQHGHLRDIIYEQLGHVMQVAVLTHKRRREKVLVGNTHLFYHPMASHIRAMQMLTACRQLHIDYKAHASSPIIFCGDFNAHPKSGAMKLLLEGRLPASHERTWKYLHAFEWEEGQGGEDLSGVTSTDLSFPPSFPQLRSAYAELPKFTHLIEGFMSTLDYIVVSDALVPVRSAPMPSIADVKKYVAMPNEFMPSDHVSLVCDLKWREES